MNERKSIIDEYVIKAIKEKDKYMSEAFRSIKAKMIVDITSKKPQFKEDQARFQAMLKLEIKERKETNGFISDHSDESWIKNNQIIMKLSDFLPQQLSEDEQTQLIKSIIEQQGYKSAGDFGKLMGQLKDKRDQLDMQFISAKAKEFLQ